MVLINIQSVSLWCFVLVTSLFAVDKSSAATNQLLPLFGLPLFGNEVIDVPVGEILSGAGELVDGVATDATSILRDRATKALCKLETDELIKYYGYAAERVTVTTEDGYILTVFRCNSKKTSSGNSSEIKIAVVLQHGLISSSDDFCMNPPNQGLAYVLADAGYDVFITNNRGNYYSRRHKTFNPNQKEFWNFTWTDIGKYDYPAVYDYVIKRTGNKKVFVVGHSQGTSAMISALSERPKINNLIHAASLLAPIGYINNSARLYHFLEKTILPLDPILKDTEVFPRGVTNGLGATICNLGLESSCNNLLNILFGQSKNQTNATMVPTYICHFPSGSALNQFAHYGNEIRYGYFGPDRFGSENSSDFDLSQIKAPISLHYSPSDVFTNPIDVERLRPQLKSLAFVQKVSNETFNHSDFVWSINANKIVYSKVLEFFKNITLATRI